MKRRLFVWLVLLVWGLHAWIGLRLLPAMSQAWPAAEPFLLLGGNLLLLASAIAIPFSALARFMSVTPRLRPLVWAGLIGMGAFSSLLVLTLLREVMLLLMPMAEWITPTIDTAGVETSTAWAVVAGTVAMSALGFVNARQRARIVHVDVPLKDLPDSLHGFRIAQISDVHIGPTIDGHYVNAIVHALNTLEADLVAITGDLVDGTVRRIGEHARPLADIRSRHGTFFVTGNHEYYSGAHGWIDHLQTLGIRCLLNEHQLLGDEPGTVMIAGITDYTAHQFDPAHRSDPKRAISGASRHAHVKILLAHQPRSAAAADEAGFDVQLSGHTHGGQFWPWGWFVPLQQPYTAGLHRHGRLWVYTSRGTGYWGPPKRLGAPSEITCLQLVKG